MSVRVRFAPSPTGALHIGGIRTALYNYLFARKHSGTFILRIEDTDQNRLVEGAEKYIVDALAWVGLNPDESPEKPGDYGPYRQSERLPLYKECAQQLLDNGQAYMAFDTAEDLESKRSEAEAAGGAFLYNASTRDSMTNSLALSPDELANLLEEHRPFTVRLKVNPEEDIRFFDLVRGWVTINSSELDDKVLLKTDGFPTYHLANVVDDYLMKVSHVIRGEEWLSSTPHHVLLYRAFDWTDSMPAFAHLPLILKPNGKGKLSKRDGEKLGIPVFPMTWKRPGDVTLDGFKEAGFMPEALINFLCLLGWHPEDDRELMPVDEMIDLFTIDRINKSGARFDFEKAKWFNHQYITNTPSEELFIRVGRRYLDAGYEFDKAWLLELIELLKDRVTTLNDFVSMSEIFFNDVTEFETEPVLKKWSPTVGKTYREIVNGLSELEFFDHAEIEKLIKEQAAANEVGLGAILPAIRVALTGSAKGPDLFKSMELLGQITSVERLNQGLTLFNSNQ